MDVHDGRRRVVIENVTPEIDAGRFPIKRVVGESVRVEADIFTDGHDALGAILLHRRAGESGWIETAMQPLVNDRWAATFSVDHFGRHEYTLEAWIDHFESWRRDLKKRIDARQNEELAVQMLIGADLIEEASGRAAPPEQRALRAAAAALRDSSDLSIRLEQALGEELEATMRRHADRSLATRYPRNLGVVVDRERARFSSWYELFPRSTSTVRGGHGTFRDVIERLPYVASMGFDVLYLPPIHPIGVSFRKGRNNALVAEQGDPGSPWAIGSVEGGHTSIHPQLGTMDEFQALIGEARRQGLEIALDIAFQVSPDHPWVREHPSWFRQRPDGTIQYAENPPKKYQDIYPLNFDSPDWQALWRELRDVFLFWAANGVRIFRVDNPHTKAFSFWEWAIGEIKEQYPDAIFLAEAFTRPKVMYYLAKLGFTQSYTYFAWRDQKWELTEYFTELTGSDVREYFRPNAWPNTPDILTEALQHGGRPAFMARHVLAATLCANYGIYGPAYELQEHLPRESGSEEYLGSEKYEIREWNLDDRASLRDFITRVNRIRNQNRALHSDWSLRFHPTTNEHLICYSKATGERDNVVLVVVNLDPYHRQSGEVDLDLRELGVDGDRPFQVHDLLTGGRYLWHGSRNYVELDPWSVPAHLFVVRRRVLSEESFEYYA
ncbi:MAG TPA: alpha-1,4-glucan--maltose-1-phosphate maltosyltransferase [Thermoanaerobaculia bacterium]|nr:alpha-1,4-glucan--maltose-1-phosphate maltosyltransferase [Thermoanaerobaculia bacterium]